MATERCPKCKCGSEMELIVCLDDDRLGEEEWICPVALENPEQCELMATLKDGVVPLAYAKELESKLAASEAANKVQWDRGYYCAVSALIRECGDDGSAKSIYAQGGDPANADAEDKEVFIEAGWMLKEEL